MQIKLFNVPISDTGSSLEEMNGFLRNNKVLDVGQEFVQSDRGSIWCFCVRYIDGALPSKSTTGSSAKAKVDYKEVLDDATFCVFSKLRVCRKLIAETEAIPAYAVFIDEELAGIAALSEINMHTMATVKGVGIKKVEKFGSRLIELYEKTDE